MFGRLAGYEDVNDADRLAHDPAMRAIVDRGDLDRAAASTSRMGRFETAWLSSEANLAALADLSGAWISPAFRVQPVGDLETCALRPGNAHSADGWKDVLEEEVLPELQRGAEFWLMTKRICAACCASMRRLAVPD